MNKKLIVCLLVLVLCLSVFTGCNENNTTGGLSDEVLKSLLASVQQTNGNVTETPADYELAAVVVFGADKAYIKWTSDKTEVVIGDVVNNYVTVDVDDTVTAPVNYVLTATLTDVDGVEYKNKAGETYSVTFNRTLPVKSTTEAGAVMITDPQVGETYKMAMYQKNDKKYYYMQNVMDGYYVASSDNSLTATDITVVDAEGGFALSLNIDGNTKYLAWEVSGTHNNLVFSATPTTWTWNNDLKAITATNNGTTVYIGTYGTYHTFGLSKLNDSGIGSDSYPAYLATVGQVALSAQTLIDRLVVPYEVEADFELSTDVEWTVVSGSAITLNGSVATITRGSADAEVVLKATATLDGVSASKEFTITVLAEVSLSLTGSLGVLNLTGNGVYDATVSGGNCFKSNTITLLNEVGTSSSGLAAVQEKYAQRFYKGSTVTITCAGMKAIKITCDDYSDMKYATGLDNLEMDGVTVQRDGAIVYVLFDTAVNEVTFSMGSQMRVEEVEVFSAWAN